MQNTGLGVAATLCSDVDIITSQLTVHISKTTNVLVCGQSIINNYLNSFLGVLLCVKK
jgi:hypothetical protein